MLAEVSKWLETESRWPKFFYADRDARRWYAGVGEKKGVVFPPTKVESIENELREFSKSDDFIFAGMRFDTESQASEEWQNYGAAFFVVPEELRSGELMEARSYSPILSQELSAPSAGWRQLFSKAEEHFKRGDLSKVILADRGAIPLKEKVWECVIGAASSYNFAFSPLPGEYFFGASPELLYRREGAEIICDALAGTRLRAHDEERDDEAKKDLLGSAKDREEHDVVIRFLKKRMAEICNEVYVSETKIKTLNHLYHLHTLVKGSALKSNQILSHLHPTPALSGSPQQEALKFIREKEHFDRGWYGGAVGVIHGEFESFSVAIRSILQNENRSYVYYGAGVVPSSTCASEWEEIHIKKAAILDNLDASLRVQR